MDPISASNLHLTLHNNTILDSINLQIKKGETIVLLGKNGCGKTMLLKTMVGLFKPNQGTVKVFGKNLYEISKIERIDIMRQIGYLFQKSGLFDSLNIAENVMFGLRRFKKDSEENHYQKAVELLRSTGLVNIEKKMPSELSGGMQKRAGIARAIALEPAILLLDDPTAGLDPVLSDAIADLIIELREKIHSTVVTVTHDLKIAKKLATRIGLMNAGKLIKILSNEEFQNSDDEFIRQYRTGSLIGPIPVLDN